jgi:hypothetical protein
MPHLIASTRPRGAVVDVSVSPSIPRQQELYRTGMSVPRPVGARALIDTGAALSCIDPSIAALLGLVATGTANLHTASTQGVTHLCSVYDVCLTIPVASGTPFRIITLPAVEAVLSPQGIDMLIGRDVLEHATMFYDGPNGRVTISF